MQIREGRTFTITFVCQAFKMREDVTSLSVKKQTYLASHLSSSGPCLDATLTFLPLQERHCFITRQHGTMPFLSIYSSRYEHQQRYLLPWNPPSLMVLIPLHFEDVKLFRFIFSHVSVLLFEKDTELLHSGQSSFLSLFTI